LRAKRFFITAGYVIERRRLSGVALLASAKFHVPQKDLPGYLKKISVPTGAAIVTEWVRQSAAPPS
jgi:hypothetical protein